MLIFLRYCILDLNTNFVKKGIVKKMSKSTKKTKRAASSKKPKKIGKSSAIQSKAEEYVGYLLELHRLQGVLLNRLHREV
jgi:hypothetical protein